MYKVIIDGIEYVTKENGDGYILEKFDSTKEQLSKLNCMSANIVEKFKNVSDALNALMVQMDKALDKQRQLNKMNMCEGIHQGIAIQAEPIKPYPINEQHTINLYNLSPDKDIKKLADELCMYMKRCKSTAK